MRLCHVSDTHGRLEPLRGEFDTVVHSGDFLPNRTFGIRCIEEAYQPVWVHENAPRLRAWIGDKPFILTPGNHDFFDPVPAMRRMGINAFNIADRALTLDGVRFYGFPWVPPFGGWNYEAGEREMEARLEAAEPRIAACDVFVAHSPIYGVLDRNGKGIRCGSESMRTFLVNAAKVPPHYLCGHIHESHGRLKWLRDIKVSNAATTQRIIDVSKSSVTL